MNTHEAVTTQVRVATAGRVDCVDAFKMLSKVRKGQMEDLREYVATGNMVGVYVALDLLSSMDYFLMLLMERIIEHGYSRTEA